MHCLQVETYVLFGEFSEGLSPRDRPSGSYKRECSEEVREQPGYTGIFAKTNWVNIKRFLLIKQKVNISG